jgi:hypothetical protein
MANEAGDTIAVRSDDAKVARGRGNGDEHPPSPDQHAHAKGHEIEEARHVPFLENIEGELVECLELLSPVDDRLVDPHTFDRDRRLGGQKRHDLLVLLSELTVLLVGEVEVSVHDISDEDRDTEKASHRRMPRRETLEMRILCHVGKPQRVSVTEQDAQNAMVARQVSDPGARLVIDSRRDEALQA